MVEATEKENYSVDRGEREPNEQRNKEYAAQSLRTPTRRAVEQPEYWPEQEAAPVHEDTQRYQEGELHKSVFRGTVASPEEEMQGPSPRAGL